MGMAGMTSPDPTLDPHQHVTRYGKHNECNDEQNEAERDQRGGVEIADRFGELIGDGGGDGGAGREHGGGNSVRVADDEGHGHGLAEGAAEAEHHAADDS